MGRMSDGVGELLHRLDRRVGWHTLPVPIGILTLRQMRTRLRQRNLHDTGRPPGLEASTNGPTPTASSSRTRARSAAS
jgi:hypothetical protein